MSAARSRASAFLEKHRPAYIPVFIIHYGHCMLHARLLLLTFQLGHGGFAWGGLQQPIAPMVCQAVLCCSTRSSCADFVACACKRLLQAIIPTDQACGVARVSAAPPAQLPNAWCRGAEMDFRRLQCRAAFNSAHGCLVNVSPPGGTLRRAVATCCTVLQRVPRLEALLRVSTLHECLKENRLHVC